MEKANVLVMGNSGVGKSTLINAVFNFNEARTGVGKTVTKEMAIYENDTVPFRAIDTRGFEHGLQAQLKTKSAIKKWSKESVKEKNEEKYIQLIWFCVDASSKRMSKKILDSLKAVTRLWKGIPIIVVLTKSFSESEMRENEEMIESFLEEYGREKLNVKCVVPVVARLWKVNEDYSVPPMGLEELIEKTNGAIPEALQISRAAVNELKTRIMRENASALTAAATASASVIGAVPIPVADSLVLVPLQSGLVFQIGKIYKIDKDDTGFKQMAEVIVESGLVSVGAKTLISGLKAIPGINIAASVINAVVAGVITSIIGEISIAVMEKISRGELDPKDLDWIKKFADSEFAKNAPKYLADLAGSLTGNDPKGVGKIIAKIFTGRSKPGKK